VARNQSKISKSKKIVVSGSARSGTTWLAQTLSAVPGYPVIWEPFHRHTAPTAASHGIQWAEYVQPDEQNTKTEYINGVLNGKYLSTETTSRLLLKPIEYLRFKGFIIKCVNGLGVTPYLEGRKDVRMIILMRHPCAVISSKLRKGNWGHLRIDGQVPYPDYLVSTYPKVKRIFNTIQSLEERLALDWAINYTVPFHELGEDILFTSYEWILSFGQDEIRRIFSHVGFGGDYLETAVQQSGVPSATTESDSALVSGGNQLEQWTQDLSSSQIKRIYNVIERTRVGELYSRDRFLPLMERGK
jgi:hypothetical protein